MTTPTAAPTPEELAAKLRDKSGILIGGGDLTAALEAYTDANMIDAQAAQIAELTAENERLKGQVGAWTVTASQDAFRATTAEAALSASQEREKALREAAQPVADAFLAMAADWTGETPDDQRLIAPDITVGQMRAFCAALQTKEAAHANRD